MSPRSKEFYERARERLECARKNLGFLVMRGLIELDRPIGTLW